jgi:ABC-type transport system involved in multi-copper enzyme maturation permease subunit
MLFSYFYLERDPLQWVNLPLAAMVWLQNAGTVAALGLFLVFLTYLVTPEGRGDLASLWTRRPLLVLLTGLSWLGFLTLLVLVIWAKQGSDLVPGARIITSQGVDVARLRQIADDLRAQGVEESKLDQRLALDEVWTDAQKKSHLEQPGELRRAIQPTFGDHLFWISGLCAILAVVYPIFSGMWQPVSRRRVWAVAILSWKDAIRSRVLWVFIMLALVFLFADWFVKYKPENQVRNYVQILYWSMYPLFFLTAGLLGSFSIPNDIKNLTIHTVVTKPVQKFEIVLGRFLGYGLLLTACLAVVTLFSLVYIWRGVTEEARRESLTARVVAYGTLEFMGTPKRTEGINVGNMWEYRSHISGPHPSDRPGTPKQFAIWSLDQLPTALHGDEVTIEFTFDVHRMTKGIEDRGVFCSFWLVDGSIPKDQVEKRVKDMDKDRRDNPGLYRQEKENFSEKLARKHRIFVNPSVEVTDNHTQGFKVPRAFFDILAQSNEGERGGPAMRVFVSVNTTSMSQLVGMNRRDLFILVGENSFTLNFLKGMIGMWFTFLLVLALAVACSTYLSGVISLLLTLFLVLAGMATPYIEELSQNRMFGKVGGGPFESAFRVFTNTPVAVRLEGTPGASVLHGLDDAFRWLLSRLLNLIPDIGRYDLHIYVANGFDISWTQILLIDNLLPFLAYVVPWFVLAYYLINFREIANPT